MKILNLDGDYHMHSSNFSDGSSTIDEIVRYAGKIGLTEIAITDHSDATLEKFKKRFNFQNATIIYSIKRRKNVFNNTNVIFGVEGDLLNNDGDICFTIQGVEKDFIILSAHGGVFDGKDATEGFIKAIERYHDKIKFIGHPCCSSEFGVNCDIKKVVEAANKYNIPLEVNGKNIVAGNTDLKKLDYMLKNADYIYINSDAHTLADMRDARAFAINYLKENNYI